MTEQKTTKKIVFVANRTQSLEVVNYSFDNKLTTGLHHADVVVDADDSQEAIQKAAMDDNFVEKVTYVAQNARVQNKGNPLKYSKDTASMLENTANTLMRVKENALLAQQDGQQKQAMIIEANDNLNKQLKARRSTKHGGLNL